LTLNSSVISDLGVANARRKVDDEKRTREGANLPQF
jgi:hypothetical protein